MKWNAGWILAARDRKTAGTVVAVLGFCLVLFPFIVTLSLSR